MTRTLGVSAGGLLALGVVIAVGPGSCGSGTRDDVTTVRGPLKLTTGLRLCDFDGDGKCDLASWQPSTGIWTVKQSQSGNTVTQQWGAPEDIPVPGDYDHDNKTDFATWRPSTGTWAILKSSNGQTQTITWGMSEDIPVPGDYDGDLKTDAATWRPSTHTFAVLKSSNGAAVTQVLGTSADIPVPGDYDNDNKTDFATWNPQSGTWTVINSSNGATQTQAWGLPEDVPMPGDYNNDGKTDFATWRPSSGNWAVFGGAVTGWGASEDIPVAADFDGDGKTDLATLRPSSKSWAVKTSSGSSPPTGQAASNDSIPVARIRLRPRVSDFDGDAKTDMVTWRHSIGQWAIVNSHDASTKVSTLGISGDVPIGGDFDGDRVADMATWRPTDGNWRVTQSSTGTARTPTAWGASFDIPLRGDFDGDGKSDIAVYRPSDPDANGVESLWAFILSGREGTYVNLNLGKREEIPLPADYDGDGKTDIAVWDPATGNWRIRPSSTGVVGAAQQWGQNGDIPVPADFDGDRHADVATWRPSTGNWAIIQSSNGTTRQQVVGVAGDIPVPADFDGDGRADLAVWTPSTGTWKISRSSDGTVVTQQWGASEDIPMALTLPVWPWYNAPLSVTSLAAPTTFVADRVDFTPSGPWEYSAAVAAPGTTGCSTGRRFLSGQTSSGADLFSSSLGCTATNTCSTSIISRLALQTGEAFESDNIMTRLRDGTILMSRGVTLNGPTNGVSENGVWASSDCGGTWTRRGTLDPRDQTRFPPPEYPADPNASYGTPQKRDANGNPLFMGGWDREEIYADPWSDNVYMTMTGNGGTDAAGNGPKYQDTLLIRSADSGATWRSTVLDAAEVVVPGMMTSIPGRVFVFTCRNQAPFLWWSDDNGATVSAGVRLSFTEHCMGGQWGLDGSTSISRIRWSPDKTATVRVVYPTVHTSDGRQRFAILNVRVTPAGAVYPTFVREIATSGKDLVQVTQIQPDLSLAGLSAENASLIYWKELSPPGVTPQAARAEGIIVRDDATMTSIFHVSTTSTGATRSWANTTKTGDYAKGAFYYDAASSQLRYFIPWLELTSSGTATMHTRIVGTPK